MGFYKQAYWANEGQGRTRRERQSGSYSFFVPSPLFAVQHNLALSADVAADVAAAERAIIALNANSKTVHNLEGVARLLLRTEAVASSHIEGLSIGPRRLLRAEFALGQGAELAPDNTAVQIIGNIHAMQDALAGAQAAPEVTVPNILQIHAKLCEGTNIAPFGGLLRSSQNWVGGNSFNPLGAEFVPPSPSYLVPLLEDLAAFCNSVQMPALVQAALAHAQFETIHPFVDGNGRTGRALVHLVLRRRGLAPHLVPPISLMLATHSKSYVEGLTAFRFEGEPTDAAAAAAVNEWISFFAGMTTSACEAAVQFEERADALQATWREQLGSVRANSALECMLGEMLAHPVFSAASMAAACGRSVVAVNAAIERCVESGIVKPVGSNKRNRVFEVPAAIAEFSRLEERLHRAG